ncbi:S8 family peptidase [Saccharomonospora sp. NPDC046836]|uniref:S8 family peptidase n=1 Tax=Saccharomonospora sp. NPDC046836 TaxID=3156921 RepID=UPI00340B2056
MGNSGKLRRGLTAGAVLAGVTGLVATGAGAAAAAPMGTILSANTADAVDGSYLVVLEQDSLLGTVAALAGELAGDYGASVTRTFGSALHGFSIQATEAEARRLAANSDVAYVVQNQRVRASDGATAQQAPPSWGLDRIDQRDLPLDETYTATTNAENVTAYVIDTGVAADHPTFGGRVSGGVDFIDNDSDPDDENGHGTHVAGTIGGEEYGVAKGVQIVPVRVLDADGSGTTEQVVAGIDWVAQNASGPSVANMSLGGPADPVLDEAVRGAIAAGVTFGIAAGNEAQDAGGTSPARVTEAITVAASDEKDAEAGFSNYGTVVDLYAPGVDITSAWHDGGENTISGTSMATPHVVGAAALYLSANPEATPADVESALVAAATPDKITNPSAGTPNRLLYTGE